MADATEVPDLRELSPYEQQAWHDIQRWKASPSSRRWPGVARVRSTARRVGRGAAERWNDLPGTEHVGAAVQTALNGGQQALADAVAASLQRERILDAVRRAGGDVGALSDLRGLDLRVLDEACPPLKVRYAAASATSGACSGLVAGGGTAAVLGTAGVAAAPSGVAVACALGADVTATLALAARVVAHYGGHYGYDARLDTERAVLLAVIGAGMVGPGASKELAMLHVRQVSMMVARRAAWKELGEETIVKLIQALFAKLSVNLTKRKLGQALLVAGVALGAGFNYGMIRKVGEAASYAYRERFLVDKYGLDDGVDAPADPGVLELGELAFDHGAAERS
jgi:hypothetical protein